MSIGEGEVMDLWVGTSGYSYKEWKGSFYPEDLPDKEMLAAYARKLPAVEINNTFYRLPTPALLKSWADQVPETFRFVLKASRRITHIKRLKECEEETEYLFRTAETLGKRLGAILFQLPPFLRKDVSRLDDFLRLIPDNSLAAFEFRHESWFEKDVYDLLKKKECTLCFADTEENKLEALVSTASWGYLRLRKPEYGEKELKEWVKTVKEQEWNQAFVFFKHEDGGVGPKLAHRFLELAGLSTPPRS
jgi:uncharacterized protein YecE (DUF72 family)